jgi:two-component system response regulator NreC
MNPIRIIIADDHALLRSGLRLLMNGQKDLCVIGEAGTLNEVTEMVANDPPDVLILDLTMPGASGLSGVTRLRSIAPAMKIIVLTMHDDPAYARSAMAIGASGYLVKSVADTELLSTIRAVAGGGIYVHVGNQPVPSKRQGDDAKDRLSPVQSLSMREREVLELVAHGHTSQMIADKIGVSVKTIESYRARLMQKLGLSSRADLMRLAIELGLVGGPPQP